jgi:beta-glucosidase
VSAHPYLDPRRSAEERAADLLRRLTPEEKIGQLIQYFYFEVPANLPAGTDPAAAAQLGRLSSQRETVHAEIEAARTGSVLFVRDAATINALQRRAVEGTRLGIPLLFGFDVIHGHRTVFPVPIALAASWRPETARAAQEIAAREARAVGIHWTFAPMVDIAQDPRWGRIIEGAGEDPVLGAAMAAAQVSGFQGDGGAQHVLAGAKHLAGYGAGRGGRDYEDVELSESEFWNVYVPPFRAAVEAGTATVMSAYMDLNGVPASGNRWLLTDVLRDELGFDGFVVSDANAVSNMQVQHFARDSADAAARAVTAGLDMEMTMFAPAFRAIPDALANGSLTQADVDRSVERVLRAKFRLGLFETPYVDEVAAAAVLATKEHRTAAQAAACDTFVLLKNDGAALPLRPESLHRIAVIGSLAGSRRDTLGPWVFDHDTAETVSILDGLRSRLGATVRIEYEPGASIPERAFPSPFDALDPTIEPTPVDIDDDAAIDGAVMAAATADVAVVVVGQRQNQVGEKASVASLDLPGRQLEQLRAIVATGTPVVLLVMSGRPLDLQWAAEHVPAILQVWYPGTRGGDAVAAALVGAVSPGGRLPFTWPRHVGQLPMIYNHLRTFHPEEKDERYSDEPSSPLYPFGHGLSYATFVYSKPMLDRASIRVGETVTISVEVTNESEVDADEVVQLYTHQRYGAASRPERELKAFRRVAVPASSTVSVAFTIGPKELQYWSSAARAVEQDATIVDVWVGGSSTAGSSTMFEVVAA